MLFGIQIISKIERTQLRYEKFQIMRIYPFSIKIRVNSNCDQMIKSTVLMLIELNYCIKNKILWEFTCFQLFKHDQSNFLSYLLQSLFEISEDIIRPIRSFFLFFLLLHAKTAAEHVIKKPKERPKAGYLVMQIQSYLPHNLDC